MLGYPNNDSNAQLEKEISNLCLVSSLRKALRILFRFRYLDLTINPNTGHFGLRFYTLFNRLDAVGGEVPSLRCDDFVSLQADINVPNGYTPLFDTTNRNTIIPLCDLRAVAFVVQPGKEDDLVRELERKYDDEKIYDAPCSCNKSILDALVDTKCDPFDRETVYDIGVQAIDRSQNPIRGKVVAYDSQLIWVQVVEPVATTFYIVPLKDITFIAV